MSGEVVGAGELHAAAGGPLQDGLVVVAVEDPGEGGSNARGGGPGADHPPGVQPARAELEELHGVQVAGVGAPRPERVGLDEVVAGVAKAEGVAPVGSLDGDAPVVEEMAQTREILSTVQVTEKTRLGRRDLEDLDAAGLGTAAGGPGGVARTQPHDRGVPRGGMNHRGDRSQQGVGVVPVGEHAVALAVDEHEPETPALRRDPGHARGVLVEAGRPPVSTVQALPTKA